ncbi:uncharacterized protein BCR38DRAFT_331072, partial [Pseudomassariella vexata]
KSRWWTRGWTLHELLAPTNLVFFSVWTILGIKSNLADWFLKFTPIYPIANQTIPCYTR